MIDEPLRVPMDDIDEGDDEVARLDGEPFTGLAYESGDGERLESEMAYRDGLPHGTARDYFADGRTKGETEFREGRRHGIERDWYENGVLASESEFEFDVLVERKRWDALGKQTSHFVLEPGEPQYRILEMLRRRGAK